MTTQTERIYQAALLTDAAYVTFNEGDYLFSALGWQDASAIDSIERAAFDGTSADDDVPFGNSSDGRGWNEKQFAAFAERYRVVYHQPNEDNGFSATLFYDTVEQKYTVAFRGTEQLWDDIATTDLLLALGLSDLPDTEQHSSIGQFFQGAGLLDSNGVVKPEYAGKVDFVGHSLGGHLALWAMYEFRELFGEVYTFNGAGISNIPFLRDANYINNLVAANPLSEAELGRIHNIFAEEGPELTANDITFFRPGERVGAFIERRDLLGTVLFHSMSLLVDSLSVYRLLGTLDDSLEFGTITDALYSISNNSVGSLDRAVAALSDLLGPDYAFDTLASAEQFYQDLGLSLGDADTMTASVTSLLDLSVGELVAAAGSAGDAGRGYRYALDHLLPFAVTSGHESTAIGADAYALENYSSSYLEDRGLFLTTLLRMNSDDGVHGDLLRSMHFMDLQAEIAFSAESVDFGMIPVPDSRARLAFGTSGPDIGTISASSTGDRLYGMSGNDEIQGLGGADYIEGGAGEDTLDGGDGGDVLFGGPGQDSISGGRGVDYLLGGEGRDTFVWNWGDGEDVIGDYDDGGDRIVVNGVDLATLEYERTSAGSPFYVANGHSEITLRYSGDFLDIVVGSGPDAGGITATLFSPATGADYGIVLHDYVSDIQVDTDLSVAQVGLGQDEVDPSAYWRQKVGQGGLDWSALKIDFNAAVAVGYSGGGLHGTLGGAFEGGSLADLLTGDSDSNALHGLGGADTIDGGAGYDLLEGGAGSDVLLGGEGGDILFGSSRAGLADTLDGQDEHDQFYLAHILDSPQDSNTLDGGAGDDLLSGGEYTDYISGGAGSDYLLGGSGQDYLSGGDERDIIYGDSALNYRYFEASPGQLSEKLEIAFADGSDSTGLYDDVVEAGSGNDTVWGELGNDDLYGQAGDDNLIGDRFHDQSYFAAELPAYGASHPELDSALHGDDRLYGGPGADLLLGLGGSDLLVGGEGRDDLLGGAGDDTYMFRHGDGLDTIQDSEGTHTLLFVGVELDELQIVFQGDQVTVGTTGGQEGFQFARDQWPQVRIALDTADAVVARSSVNKLYLDSTGNLLLGIAGSSELGENQLNQLMTVDLSDPQRPFLNFGEAVESLRIEASAGAGPGAEMRVNSVSGPQLVLSLGSELIVQGLDFFSADSSVGLTLVGMEGVIQGSSSDDQVIGSSGDDEIHTQDGDDTLQGGSGNDSLFAGPGDDVLLGEGGDDYLDSGPGTDFIEGGEGDDHLLAGTSSTDVFRFADGDGADLIDAGSGSGTVRLGEIRFAADVDTSTIEFSYRNGDAFIAYGSDNLITLNVDTISTALDNTLSRYTLVAEGNPGWIPVMRADGYVGDMTGSYGADWIIGGDHIETIMPGYGDDLIEPGGGPDRIILNDLYLSEPGVGIGFKTIRGQGDNDIIHTPLHQGLRFLYDPGDGHDTIDYDWSFSRAHPYRLELDSLNNGIFFQAHGVDALVFGEGITLSDLDFYRQDQSLYISILEGTGSVTIENFFSLQDSELTADTSIPNWMNTEGGVPASLLELGIPGVLPMYPLNRLEFADGSIHELTPILESSLQDISGFIYGTPGDDVIVVDSSNTVIAAAGNDVITLDGGDSLVDPGEGDDLVDIRRGENTVRFGPGDGSDLLLFDENAGPTVLELGEGLGIDDIAISFHPESEAILLLSFPGTGDAIQLAAYSTDALSGEYMPVAGVTLSLVRFADGSEITGDELLGMAGPIDVEPENILQGTDGRDLIIGTPGSDTLIGGPGNDRMEGLEGDDLFLVSGNDQGRDRFIGGEGFDRIIGSPVGDTFTMSRLLLADAIEQIDGGAGVNRIAGTDGRNLFNFSATNLLSIAAIEGGAGDDRITGSAGDDTIVGGAGNDRLSGGPGSDSYIFAAGDGRDVLVIKDADSQDSLHFTDIAADKLWITRNDKHLFIHVVGSDDQVKLKNWYVDHGGQLDAIYAGDQVLLRNQVELLVSAMAAYDVPSGVDTFLTGEMVDDLQPVLVNAWQEVA